MGSIAQKPCLTRRMVNGYFNKIGRSYGQEMWTLGITMIVLLFFGWLFKI